VHFESCRFDTLFVRSLGALAKTTMIDCQVRAIAVPNSSVPTYDPNEIELALSRLARATGVPAPPPALEPAVKQEDEALKHTERVLRRFLRATEINENVI